MAVPVPAPGQNPRLHGLNAAGPVRLIAGMFARKSDILNFARGAIVALAAAFPFAPFTAAVLTAIAYVGPEGTFLERHAIAFGAITAVSAWLALGPLSWLGMSAKRLNMREYRDLRQLRNDLELALTSLPDTTSLSYRMIRQRCDEFDKEVKIRDARWILGTGYVNLWNAIHRAQEELLLLRGPDELIREIDNDLHRLNGSDIANAGALSSDLTAAKDILCPYAEGIGVPPGGGPAPIARQDPPDRHEAEKGARQVVKTVRAAIDDYRDSLRDGLVRSRITLVLILLLASCATEALVVFLTAARIQRPMAIALVVFFAAGALTGIVNQARLRRQPEGAFASAAVEDYGFANLRILTIPLLSGLTAIIGVYIAAALQIRVIGASLGPGDGTGPIPTLREIFSLDNNRTGILIAIVFGLTPELLFRYLTEQTERFRSGLQSSQAATPMGKTPGATK